MDKVQLDQKQIFELFDISIRNETTIPALAIAKQWMEAAADEISKLRSELRECLVATEDIHSFVVERLVTRVVDEHLEPVLRCSKTTVEILAKLASRLAAIRAVLGEGE